MPLPRKVVGQWSADEASHPRVESFELSKEEKAFVEKLNAAARKAQEKQKANQEVEIELGGFSDFASSAVDVASAFGGPGSLQGGYEEGEDFSSDLGGEDGLTEEQRALIDTTLATAANRLLLVRFMDFTIERGNSYQYRVRLKMKNPNYRHPLDELEDPAMAAEPTLTSDWSEPTPDVFAPVGQRLYLTDVSNRSSGPETVDVAVYTDSLETGMPVLGKIKIQPGMRIADNVNIELVDLTRDVLERQEIVIETGDTLATAEAFSKLSRSVHKELVGFITGVESGLEQIPDEICVVNSKGDLELRAVNDRADKLSKDRQEIAFILKQYEAWRVDKQSEDDNPFGGFGEGEGEGNEGDYGAGRFGGGR